MATSTETPSTALSGGLYRNTLSGLLTPRRSIPVSLVCGAMIVSQAELAPEPAAGPLAASMCLAFLLTAPYLWRRLNPAGKPWLLGALQLICYAGSGVVVAYLVSVPLPRLLHVGPTLLTSDYTSYISLALFWVGGWGLGRDLDHEEGIERARERARALEREAKRAQLLAIKSHLDPHFLFNTLNAIAEWCRQDGEVAERAILKLSDMLRVVLMGVPLAAWSLREELELVEQLLDLHLVRDPDLFRVARSITVDVEGLQVPPLILLPLVENAVKHGPAAGRRGTISLTVSRARGVLTICLENPGRFAGLRVGGSGYPLVEQRLALAYDGAAKIQIQAAGEGTRVTLELPPTPASPRSA